MPGRWVSTQRIKLERRNDSIYPDDSSVDVISWNDNRLVEEKVKRPYFATSRLTLVILAAVVWIVGGIVLALKGQSLLSEAWAIQAVVVWPGLSIVGGLLIGAFKGVTLFRISCRRNLNRIEALERPRLWQFYRPGFFAALFIMILTGASLSRLVQGHYSGLLAVATLDISLSTALLGSSVVFFRQRIGR